MSKYKICNKCKKTKPVEDFIKGKFICKECRGK